MKVIEKYGRNREEDRYQIEDWREDLDIEKYPGLRSMIFCVGCYVLANDKYPYFPTWRTFRIEIGFETLEAATECFRSLIEGKKKIMDYKDQVYQPNKLEWFR